MSATGKQLTVGATIAALGVVLVAALTSTRPAKEPPPCQPWPGCRVVATIAPTLAPLPTSTATSSPTSIPTAVTAPTATPILPPSGACSATVAAVLPDPASYSDKFVRGYADSLAVDGGFLWLRENYGASKWALDTFTAPRTIFDVEQRAGYRKVGDGQQTISNVAASNGTLLLGYKQDTHGSLVLNASSGAIRGEFAPPRALGGVAISSGRGLALTTQALWSADLATFDRMAVPGAPGGIERSLVADGALAAYVTLRGDLVIVRQGVTANVFQVGAASVGIEDGVFVVGVRNGVALVSSVGSMATPKLLPDTPRSVALLHGVAWSWIGSVLYREGSPALSLDPSLGPVFVTRGAGDYLYVGTGQATVVVRVCR